MKTKITIMMCLFLIFTMIPGCAKQPGMKSKQTDGTAVRLHEQGSKPADTLQEEHASSNQKGQVIISGNQVVTDSKQLLTDLDQEIEELLRDLAEMDDPVDGELDF